MRWGWNITDLSIFIHFDSASPRLTSRMTRLSPEGTVGGSQSGCTKHCYVGNEDHFGRIIASAHLSEEKANKTPMKKSDPTLFWNPEMVISTSKYKPPANTPRIQARPMWAIRRVLSLQTHCQRPSSISPIDLPLQSSPFSTAKNLQLRQEGRCARFAGIRDTMRLCAKCRRRR